MNDPPPADRGFDVVSVALTKPASINLVALLFIEHLIIRKPEVGS